MLADVIATLPLGIVLVTGCLVSLINLVNDGDTRFLGRLTALGFGLSTSADVAEIKVQRLSKPVFG